MIDAFLDKYVFPYTGKFIGRSKKTEDGIPIYTEREDILNTVTHISGILLGIGMMTASAFGYHSYMGLAGGLVFGFCLVFLYTASSVYHGVPLAYKKAKKVLHILDFCSIFVLVAGTCTPFALRIIESSMDPTEWIFYTVIWAVAAVGIALLSVNIKRFASLATILYVALGVLLVTRTGILFPMIGGTGVGLMVAGGVAYLIGLLFYGLASKREWMHSVFHIFCLLGSLLHCVCVFLYVI